MKTAFICFFQYSQQIWDLQVIRSMFLCWPGEKKIFQISHLNHTKNSNLYSKIFTESPVLKLISIPYCIQNYKIFKKSKNKIIVIEGPSWIGYSFVSLILIRIFLQKPNYLSLTQYRYEVRKMTSSF